MVRQVLEELRCRECKKELKNCAFMSCKVCPNNKSYCFNCNTHRGEDLIIESFIQESIPKISTYANGLHSGQGDLHLEDLESLFGALHTAFNIASEGQEVKWGDTDEADAISGIISRIWEKYQDKATLEQRKTWENARLGRNQ